MTECVAMCGGCFFDANGHAQHCPCICHNPAEPKAAHAPDLSPEARRLVEVNTRRLRAERDRLRATVGSLMTFAERLREERDAARALCERYEKALKEIMRTKSLPDGPFAALLLARVHFLAQRALAGESPE